MVVEASNPTDVMENELISRWQRVMTSIPRGTMGGYFGYSSRQLQYLGLVIKEVLRAKDASLQVCFIFEIMILINLVLKYYIILWILLILSMVLSLFLW